jgi:predicted RND superfamily exporter protein
MKTREHSRPWIERLVAIQMAGAWWFVLGACLVCVVSAFFASRLDLRTDFAELLPSGDPSVKELRRLQARLPGMSALIVNIQSPDPNANVEFADELAVALRNLPPDLVQVAVSNVEAERAWFEEHRWLYPSLEGLERLRDRLQAEILKTKNPLYVDLDEGGESVEQIAAGLTRESVGLRTLERLPDDHFASRDGQTAMVLVLPPGGLFHEHAGEQLAARARALIAEIDPARRRNLKVSFSGEVQASLEERAALENDLVWATSTCVVLVCAVVVIFFRRLRALPLIAAPALVGTLVAFAVAYFAFGYLNSSTAFLGSIIVGNGINYAIIQLARYGEERAAGAPADEALVRSVVTTLRPTGVAALAASLSYGSLTITGFRGFSQFGVIGGAGIVLAWVATVAVLPSVLWLLDRGAPNARQRPRRAVLAAGLARLSVHSPRRLLALGALLSIIAAALVWRYMRDPFEYDFRNLHSARSEQFGEARFNRVNHEVFGRALTPIVILAAKQGQTELARQALRAADARGDGGPMLADILTIDDFLPGTAAVQQAKLAVLREIRADLGERTTAALDGDERTRLSRLTPPELLGPVGPLDLPALVRRPFTETDGTLGRVILAFTRPDAYDVWNGHDMLRLNGRVGEIRLPDRHVLRSAGSAVIFAGMIRSIVHDGPRVVIVSAAGVAILVLLLAGSISGAVLVLGTLAAGMLWMVGGAAIMGLRLNFLNFVALPVTIGIGVDYGVNIYLRSRLEGWDRVGVAVRATGAAVSLCSATTIIGYGALLVADNQGLRSFGKMAILGEIACLTAALVFMPALLVLRGRRLPRPRQPAAPHTTQR